MNLIDPGLTFEIQNGIQVILISFFISFLISYLILAAKRDGITVNQWFHSAPLRYQVAVALLVTHVGYVMVRFSAWSWRIHGAGALKLYEHHLLVAGIAVSSMGVLCMIRVFTRPFYGNWPWLVSMSACIAYVLLALALRT